MLPKITGQVLCGYEISKVIKSNTMTALFLNSNEARQTADKFAKQAEQRIKSLREVVIDSRTTIYTKDFDSSADVIRRKYYEKYENPNRLRDESR